MAILLRRNCTSCSNEYAPMSSPSKYTCPALASVSLIRQRTSVRLAAAGQAHDHEDLSAAHSK